MYKEDYFAELLGLENGIPSHDTFSAVFSVINPEEFLECSSCPASEQAL